MTRINHSKPTMHRFGCKPWMILLSAWGATLQADSGRPEPTIPVFKDGEAQIVERFADPDMWIRHDLWVETSFDSDGDGRMDRMHVDVTRPRQTETEALKLPVIYVTSPYFAGTTGAGTEYFWDPHQELSQAPPERQAAPAVERRGERPIISKSHAKTWVPRGYIVVHSSSPGTGLSQGCPTVGGANESLAPKAVVNGSQAMPKATPPWMAQRPWRLSGAMAKWA